MSGPQEEDPPASARGTSGQRQAAISRWDNEGGAGLDGSQEQSGFGEARVSPPRLSDAELVHLRVRVIALENLLIALLGDASDRQLGLVREMAAYIFPRSGFTHHPLTIQAAHQMLELIDRAGHFQGDKRETYE